MDQDHQADQKLKSLTDALTQGVDTIKEGDREVRYRSLDDLIRIRSIYLRETRTRTTPMVFTPKVGKGL